MDSIARSAMQIDPALYTNNAAPAARMIASQGRAMPQLASMGIPPQQLQMQAQQSVSEQANKISLPDDRMVSFDLKSFLKQHNEIAHDLEAFHSMATNQWYAASQQLSSIIAGILRFQKNARQAFQHNGINPDELDFGPHNSFQEVLSKDYGMPNNISSILGQRGGLGDFKPDFKKPRKARKPKDPDAPKRPITAFFLFSRDSRDEIRDQVKREAGTDDVKPGDVQKAIQDRWNSMGVDAQQLWKDKYQENMKDYEAAMKKWKSQGLPSAGGADVGLVDALVDEDDEDEEDAEGEEEEEESSSSSSSEEEEKEPTPPPVKPKKPKKAPTAEVSKPKKTTSTESDSKKRKNVSPPVESGSKKKKSSSAKPSKAPVSMTYGDDY